MKRHLEELQEAAVSLVTFVSHGTEAVHRRHNKCQGDGNLWESHTLCHCSDTCECIQQNKDLAGCMFPILSLPTWAKRTVRKSNTCPLTAYCRLHRTPPHCSTPQRSGLRQTPLPCGWWDGVHPLLGTWWDVRGKGSKCAHCYYLEGWVNGIGPCAVMHTEQNIYIYCINHSQTKTTGR